MISNGVKLLMWRACVFRQILQAQMAFQDFVALGSTWFSVVIEGKKNI